MVRSEGNMSLKNPETPPGIDPGTVYTYMCIYLFILYLIVMSMNGVSENNMLCVSVCAGRVSPLFELDRQKETHNAMIIMHK